MSKQHTDRSTAGNNDHSNDQQRNVSASLDSEHTGASAAAKSSLAAAASSAASSSVALPPVPPSLSPAQRLYSDALISVFGFLDLRGVIRAHGSCRAWRDAAHKEPSRNIVLQRDPSDLAWFCASPLRHHVSEYIRRPFSPQCTLEQVALLSAFPSLTRVTIFVDLSSLAALHGRAGYAETIAATVAEWPARLTSLNISFPKDEGEPKAAQACIDCVGRLFSLTELALWLWLPAASFASLTLQPLLQLTRLQTFQPGGSYAFDAAACSVLKQLSSLTHFNLEQSGVSPEALKTLCAPPHQWVSLQRTDLGGATAAHMEALLQLPALCTLQLTQPIPSAAAALPRFPRMRSLQLRVDQDKAVSDFMPHITQCAQLTALSFQFSKFTLDDLTQLSRSLTALTSLAFHQSIFDGLDRPDSLSCLQSLPQLRELKFSYCSGGRLVHLTDPAFTSLPSLRSLSVTLSADSIVEARSLFALPCKLMPQLTHTCIDF